MNQQNATRDENSNKHRIINALIAAVIRQTVIEKETYKITSTEMS